MGQEAVLHRLPNADETVQCARLTIAYGALRAPAYFCSCFFIPL